MTDIPPFVDIHCHLAPGIDDGSKSWDDTLAMARIAVSEGIETIICTPHQCGNFAHNHGDAIRELVSQVQAKLDEAQISLNVLPGADVRIDAALVKMLRSGEVLSLADLRRHVLLELPHEVYVSLDKLLDELKAAKIVGILSHPERNEGILSRPSLIEPLVDAGCLMQVTAGSLIGAFGSLVQKSAESFVQKGLVHFISTDAHGPKARRPLMREAFARCVQLVGEAAAIQICCTNPAAVAHGNHVMPGRLEVSARSKTTASLGGWFGRRKTG
jgi:protein-tyrosine phosphatase